MHQTCWNGNGERHSAVRQLKGRRHAVWGRSRDDVTGNRADPRVGSGMQQACKSGAGASRRGREKRRGRNAWSHWHGSTEGSETGDCLRAGRGPHQERRRRGNDLESQERKADARGAPEVDQRPMESDVKMPARAGDCAPAAASASGAVRKRVRGSPKATATRQGTGLHCRCMEAKATGRTTRVQLGKAEEVSESTACTGQLGEAGADDRGGSVAGRPRWLMVKAKRATTRTPTSRSSESNRLRPARPLSDRNVMGGNSKSSQDWSIEPLALRFKL